MLINERSKNKFIYFTDKTKSTRLDFYKEGIKAEYLNISKKWRSNSILPLPLWHSLSPIWKEEVFLIKFNVGASFQTFEVGYNRLTEIIREASKASCKSACFLSLETAKKKKKISMKTVMSFKCVNENRFLKDLESSRFWSKKMCEARPTQG